MTSPRRFGAQDSVVRAQILDSAEQLMLEEGYAAVTSRRLAAHAGMKQSLIYYYFRTMDELFLALFRRMSEEGLSRLQDALRAEQPIRALWELYSDRSRTALIVEILALANHRKLVQVEIARYAEQFRGLEQKALTRLFEERQIEPQIHPLVVSVLLTSLARGLVQESALGISKGHAPTRSFVQDCLRYFEAHSGALGPLAGALVAETGRGQRRTTPGKVRRRRGEGLALARHRSENNEK